MSINDSTPLPILSSVSSSDIKIAAATKTATGGINAQHTGDDGQNEGSFLDFLNAFSALPVISNAAQETALQGGSTLPLAAEVAEADRTALLALPVSSQQAIAAGSGKQTGTVAGDVLLTQSPAGVEGGVSADPDLSSRASSAALASRLAGLVQAGVNAHDNAQPAAALTTALADKTALASPQQLSALVDKVALVSQQQGSQQQNSPLVDKVALALQQQLTAGNEKLQPTTSAQIAVTSASLLPVSNPLQLSSSMLAGSKIPTSRSGSAPVLQPGSTMSVNGNIELSTSSLQPAAPEMSETDAFFAAQLKKMVVEQHGVMNTEKQLAQNTQIITTANSTTTNPVSAPQIHAATSQPILTTETGSMTSHQATISETFGKPDWNQGMARQMLWMANQNIRSAELRLNPAHLGPIEVRIEMEDDKVNLAFSSRHAAVREAVEQAMPRLREMFEESGLELSDTDVSQQSFAEQRNQEAADFIDQHNSNFSSQTDSVINDVSADAEKTASENMSLVDYYI